MGRSVWARRLHRLPGRWLAFRNARPGRDPDVAFRAELDEEFGFDEGLFLGSGGKKGAVTTH